MNFKHSSLLPLCGALTLTLGGSCAQAQSTTEQVDLPKDVPSSSSAPTPVSRLQPPAEMPAKPPKVICKEGQLTIEADNSTMASVFAAIHGCIGIAIDLPSGASSTRIFATLGPGPVNQVLQSLISSTDMDYVIQLSDTEADKIQAIFLTARTDDTKEPSGQAEHASTPTRQAWLQARRNATRAQVESENSQPADSDTSSNDSTEAQSIVSGKQAPAEGKAEAASIASTAVPTARSATPADAGAAPAENTAPALADPNASPTAVTAVDPNATPDQNTVAPSTTTKPTEPSADREMQEKITNMEQLFEKRKQMIQTPSTPPQQ